MSKKLRVLLIVVVTLTVLLTGCFGSDDNSWSVPAETAESAVTEEPSSPKTLATEPKTTRKIVDWLDDETPIYEDQIVVPEPHRYDEYGFQYNLVDGTFDEYYLDEDYQQCVETPESSAFIEIMYWPFTSELRVTFRNSEDTYVYYDVSPEVWHSFKTADSKGSYFNEEIKGYYEYDKE